jgi:hypothetical protein
MNKARQTEAHNLTPNQKAGEAHTVRRAKRVAMFMMRDDVGATRDQRRRFFPKIKNIS